MRRRWRKQIIMCCLFEEMCLTYKEYMSAAIISTRILRAAQSGICREYLDQGSCWTTATEKLSIRHWCWVRKDSLNSVLKLKVQKCYFIWPSLQHWKTAQSRSQQNVGICLPYPGSTINTTVLTDCSIVHCLLHVETHADDNICQCNEWKWNNGRIFSGLHLKYWATCCFVYLKSEEYFPSTSNSIFS